jgi:PAS domain S-box-containing protein
MVLNRKGVILAHSKPGRFRIGDVLESSPLNDSAFGAVELFFQPTTAERGEQIYDIALPAIFEGEKIGVIRIGVTQKLMVERLAILRKEIATITALFACLGILIGIALSRRITKPLAQLSRTAHEIATKGLTGVRRIAIKEKDEVGKLAESFNLMTEALENSIGELNRTKDYLMTLLEVANDFIFTLDETGRFTYVNNKFFEWGYLKDDLLGKPFSSILSLPDREPGVLEALREGGANQFEAKVRDGQGSVKAVIFSTTSIWTPVGQSRGVLGIAKDVTLMKEMEAHLSEGERLSSIGAMLISLGHEINNPLGIIHGFVQELLDEGSSDPSHQFRIARILEEEVIRCQYVVASLLEFARPKPFKREFINISALLDRSLNLISPMTKKKGVKVYSHIEGDLPRVFLDSFQAQQVLVNLYLNAIDAMPQGGELRVGACLENGNDSSLVGGDAGWPTRRLTIVVSDTGYGIAEEDISHVFEAFFSKKKTEQQGTGLGLFLSKQIVESHGGRIEVESALGKGTTFRIRLPVSQSEHARSASDGKDSRC